VQLYQFLDHHANLKVFHLSNDPDLEGTTRSLPALIQALDPQFDHTIRNLEPKRTLPPALEAEIIIIHFSPSWKILPWLAGLRLCNPHAGFIMVEHSYTRSFEALHVTNVRRFRRMLKLSFSMMHKVVAVSKSQGEWLSEAASLPSKKSAAINPMTDLAPLRLLSPPVRQRGPLRLCAYGRFSTQKGFDILIAAMRRIPEDVATLRLVGLGEEEGELREQAKDLPHVTVEGPVTNPVSLLNEIDAVAIPSHFEAFGSAGAEARAAARPIIVTAVDGLTDQALLSTPNLLIRPNNVEELTAAITWLARQDITAIGLASRATMEGTEVQIVKSWNKLLWEVAQIYYWWKYV
jgi:glycosyltransferase involved in cell wall biosynthesis